MTEEIKGILSIKGMWLTAAQIAPIYRMDAQAIRHLARAGRLPFAVECPSPHRVRIYKRSFLDWYTKNVKEDAANAKLTACTAVRD